MKYKIEFFSYWHCGSGLAAGADVDALVVKDKDGLPFVPGKTMKGLVREAFIELFGNERLDELFGTEGGNQGKLFFTNAELSEVERNAIVANSASKFLYSSVASTAIDGNGVAKEHSLRKMQVVVPCTLYGEIMVENDDYEKLADSLRLIKRMGQNRNRGLGRCQITVLKEDRI